jgi:hypothetical protein
MNYAEIRKKLKAFYDAKCALKKEGVLRSERLTGEIGEWYAEKAYNASRAQTTSNRGWDLIQKINDDVKHRLQVKAHAKRRENKATWTPVNPKNFGDFDRLIIVVMRDDYLLKEWYDIPSDKLNWLSVKSGSARIVHWQGAKDNGFKVDISKLPNGSSLHEFIADEFEIDIA